MNASYTGLHGRTPWERNDHGPTTGNDHYVPEGWDELERGICPRCGQTVRWDETTDAWVVDDSLTVLVLTEDEIEKIGHAAKGWPAFSKTGLPASVEQMYDLNRPFEE